MLISRDMNQLLCDMSDCSCIDYDWLQWYYFIGAGDDF